MQSLFVGAMRRSRALPPRHATFPVQQCHFDLAAADIDAQAHQNAWSQGRESRVAELISPTML